MDKVTKIYLSTNPVQLPNQVVGLKSKSKADPVKFYNITRNRHLNLNQLMKETFSRK